MIKLFKTKLNKIKTVANNTGNLGETSWTEIQLLSKIQPGLKVGLLKDFTGSLEGRNFSCIRTPDKVEVLNHYTSPYPALNATQIESLTREYRGKEKFPSQKEVGNDQIYPVTELIDAIYIIAPINQFAGFELVKTKAKDPIVFVKSNNKYFIVTSWDCEALEKRVVTLN